MEIANLITHIEALIFASEKPLTAIEIVELVNNAFGFMEDKVSLDQVETSIDGIREKYAAEFYPFEIRQSGGGWQFLTKKDYHKTIAQLNGEKFLKRLSTAALETLAIIAYKQPITKGEIEAIRGVNTDYSIQKLLEKELIVITGRNEQMPGKPLVYNTSRHFMDYFGINSAEDLPRINEVLASQIVEPTLVNAEHFDVEEGEVLAVSEDGELVAKVGDLPSEEATSPEAGPEDAAGEDEGGATSGGLTATDSDEADNNTTARKDAWTGNEEADNDDDAASDTEHADDTPIQ
jgi:segregation and condensation protein B